MLAVPTDRLPGALGDLDPGNRALLDLSLRRGVSDTEIGELLRKKPDDVARGRDAVLELLADALDVAGHDRRERVRQAVAALPDDAWRARPAPPTPPPPPSEPAAPEPLSRDEEEDEEDEDRDEEPAPPARDELYFEPEPRRSRRIGLLWVLGLLALLGAVLAIALGGGDDDDAANESGSQPAPKQDGSPPEPQGNSARLAAVQGGPGAGRLTVTDEGATITLRGLPDPDGAYEVWLYDSVVQAKSLGTVTESSGKLEVQLPADAGRYEFLDVSLEPADGNPNHSGDSILRAQLRGLLNG